VFEIDKRVRGPEAFLQLLAGDYLTRTFQQDRKDLERLPRQAKPKAVFAQFP
jgi:hypothetical protein